MIIWLITKLVCWMYGVEMIPEVKKFFVCVSWVELFLAALSVILFVFTRLNEHENNF